MLALTLKIVVVDSSHNPVVGARVSVRTSDGRLVPPDHLTALSPSANCGPVSSRVRSLCGAGSVSVSMEGTEKETSEAAIYAGFPAVTFIVSDWEG
jgi:hypothetical protein